MVGSRYVRPDRNRHLGSVPDRAERVPPIAHSDATSDRPRTGFPTVPLKQQAEATDQTGSMWTWS